MKRSLFEISKMDCPSEEQMIRMALSRYGNLNLQFDLAKRQLAIVHDVQTEQLERDLNRLGLGSRLLADESASASMASGAEASESRVLWTLLAINFSMFAVEIGLGIYAQSTGLIADSVDMLADAIVYGMSLYAVGRALSTQNRAATLSGWFQVILAVSAFSEVIRRFIFGSEPNSLMMMAVSTVALAANVACVALLMKHRQGAVHMRASWIFSTNDVLANLGVILAGALVYFFESPWPDLLIGVVIAGVVIRGAISILKLASLREAID